MTRIDQLNQRLRDSLGPGRGTTLPRFAWMWAPDVHYFYRNTYLSDFVRRSWGERLGPVWVLCQWRRPELTPEQWWTSFKGELPYPDKGMYYAHPETAMPQGSEPTAEVTAKLIYALDRQMSMGYEAHLREINAGVEKREAADEQSWLDYCADFNPAFDNWHSGTKNGVEFQVPGLKDSPLVAA